MDWLRQWYTSIWCCDFEFHQPRGARPTPLCVVAHDVLQGTHFSAWLDGTPLVTPPWQATPETLFITYYGSAEFTCFLALGWELPVRTVDLFVEFRNATNGVSLPCGRSLLGALHAYGLQGMASETKEDMRALAIRGGPFTPTERQELLQYCATDVEALGRLLRVMAPALDVPRALLRGRYIAAAAQVEWQGVPCDVDTWTLLCDHWDELRLKLVHAINREYGVFVPATTVLDPETPFGHAVLQLAAAHQLDPYALAAAADHLWREERTLFHDTRAARRQARQRTGLTRAQITRWERRGHDAATWPGLDEVAHELAWELPALGIGVVENHHEDVPDFAERLWELLRDEEDRLPPRHDRTLLSRALALVTQDPESWTASGPLRFSTERFAAYLRRVGIPWPRLASGALAMDDATFREMARAYPAHIGPLRDVRHALSQLKLRDLAVGPDGRNRALLSVFSSRTGRNQPSNAQYIFGPACWLRSLIKPAPGRALAYIDWSQQELAIAARLSGDQAMMDAYHSGDFYLWFAKEAGAAPPEATKATHTATREVYKVVALGVLFGLSEYGIARRLHVPLSQGRELLQHHKAVFRRFWQWSDAIEIVGMLGGRVRTAFGWQMSIGRDTSGRSVRNFPMQAGGAEMLRLATCLAVERGIPVCGLIHDALLVEASLTDVDTAVQQTQAAMQEASEQVLPGFPLRTEATVVRYPDRYQDPRGKGMWELVLSLLDEPHEEIPF